jgi:diadenosine tetraphosphatase ApaH/serine/threonine PP2A family protein phosphatase
MRYLILSDIHANLEALQACLADASKRRFKETLVLGDLVGYGADPNAVIDEVLALKPKAIVRGNHDKVAIGLEQAEGFNTTARSAAQWMLEALTPGHRAWLMGLPAGPTVVDDLVEICHGSPIDEDAYIFDETDAYHAIEVARRPLCLFGHTHQPVAFQLADGVLDGRGSARKPEARLALKAGAKYLVNPGSVGQPRDGDSRAAYAIVDSESRHVDLLRVPYDIEAAQRKIIAAGLPEALAKRLAAGR